MLEDFRLRVFLELAENGSFTGTSRRLGISQPAVSQNISSLEQEVGSPLFVRSRSGLTLTEKGEALIPLARKILYWYGRIGAEIVRGESPAESARLSLPDGSRAEFTVEDGGISIKIKGGATSA